MVVAFGENQRSTCEAKVKSYKSIQILQIHPNLSSCTDGFGAKTACKANEIPAQGNALGKW